MCSCHSILECCVTFSGVKLSIRSFVLFINKAEKVTYLFPLSPLFPLSLNFFCPDFTLVLICALEIDLGKSSMLGTQIYRGFHLDKE